jgi:YD repeat-containing protein
VMNWLNANLVPFDDAITKIPRARVHTEADIGWPESHPRPGGPYYSLVQFSKDGLLNVYNAAGQRTHLSYANGRVSEVERSDGATLRVYWDDLGRPAAVADSRSPYGAAFFRDRGTGRDALADLVRLDIHDGRYHGYASVAGTSRALYDVVSEDVVSVVIQNFIAEVEQLAPVAPPRPRPRALPIAIAALIVVALVAALGMRRMLAQP